MPQRAPLKLPSKSDISDILPIKLLIGEATEMDKKTLTEQELLEGVDTYTAHADELAEVVETDIELNEAESN